MLRPLNNPFKQPFERLGEKPRITTSSINAEPLAKMVSMLNNPDQQAGEFILLKSPRAGFGKTHLLDRLRRSVIRSHEFIVLEPIAGSTLDARGILDKTVRTFSRVIDFETRLTLLDVLTRRIFALALEPLVKSGTVPSENVDEALNSLRMRPLETFDFNSESAVTAQWAMANFDLLRPQLATELCQRTKASSRMVSWWVKNLFEYSSASLDEAGRNGELYHRFMEDGSDDDACEKLVTLLNLAGLVTAPVLVLDEVEGYFGNPEAALKTCTLLNSLHQSCEKLTVIISVNSDIWETAFAPRLSSGLKDRLLDSVVELKPLTQDQAKVLLTDRAGDHVDVIMAELDLHLGVIYARGIMRQSSGIWQDHIADDWQAEAAKEADKKPISLRRQNRAASDPQEVNGDDLNLVGDGCPDMEDSEDAKAMMEKVLEAKSATGGE